ncbi:hypothetical protein [Streptomyces rapamycinicus]|uniref:Uncharacterized protein n=2 Tax=Streptomyces rapamycinicus TaxID=1226757 RepID=A0A3L8RGM5_STRRN|nr:hypothetical protein [Streptomyces rapamycinicus]MBB4785805.1 hypothetical protein [Streptomyces rapamycinicus]RLV78730.1 hypothetical protein D3C57_110135 [Streptomyces rapamycinicus NRRL 5491]UTO65958.1 hypothetical protein LJB45_28965 [Streptomyces rapamycinicus]UTP33913.1 hypothetical protein LIV37_34095 [Streptomyces rapamycinicus NRRL 5491]
MDATTATALGALLVGLGGLATAVVTFVGKRGENAISAYTSLTDQLREELATKKTELAEKSTALAETSAALAVEAAERRTDRGRERPAARHHHPSRRTAVTRTQAALAHRWRTIALACWLVAITGAVLLVWARISSADHRGDQLATEADRRGTAVSTLAGDVRALRGPSEGSRENAGCAGSHECDRGSPGAGQGAGTAPRRAG